MSNEIQYLTRYMFLGYLFDVNTTNRETFTQREMYDFLIEHNFDYTGDLKNPILESPGEGKAYVFERVFDNTGLSKIGVKIIDR